MAREDDARHDLRHAPHPSLFGGYVAVVTLAGLGVLGFMLAQVDRDAIGQIAPHTMLALGDGLHPGHRR